MRDRFLLVFFELLVIIILAFQLNNSNHIVAATSSSLQTQRLNSSDAYFTSQSTNNGRRRFLAIGNFFDTTNSAYFIDSTAYLTFSFPLNPDILISQAKITLRKYAASSSGDTPIALILRNNQNTEYIELPVIKVDNGDLDYDFLTWDVTAYLQSLNVTSSDFQLHVISSVPNPAFKQGIAVCSGNYLDSVCASDKAPQLELIYQNNTQGQIISQKLPSLSIYNAKSNSDAYQCTNSVGCKFIIGIQYQDLEENAKLVVNISDLMTNQVTKRETWSLNSVENTFDFPLSDGKYHWLLQIVDGSFTQELMNADFTIDTTPPAPPEILYHSPIGTRAGVDFILEAFNSEEQKLKIILKDSQQQVLSMQEFSTNDVVMQSSTPLINEQEYLYQLLFQDLAGNDSLSVELNIQQRNDLLLPTSISVNQTTISPANQDKNFDLLTAIYQFPESIKDLKLQFWDSKVKKIGLPQISTVSEQNNSYQIDFSGQMNAEFLKDGVYYLNLLANDQLGYPIAEGKLLQFKIDNTAPILKSVSR